MLIRERPADRPRGALSASRPPRRGARGREGQRRGARRGRTARAAGRVSTPGLTSSPRRRRAGSFRAGRPRRTSRKAGAPGSEAFRRERCSEVDRRPEMRQSPDWGSALTPGNRENSEGVRTRPRARNHDDGGGAPALN